VADNLLDLAVCLEISESLAGERTVDLQAIDEGSNGDEAVGLDILLELVVGLLVEDNGVVGLVLDCAAVSGESCEIVRMRAGGVRKRPDDCDKHCQRAPRFGRDAGCARCVRCDITYPCPLTTSSFASCLRLLLVPLISSASTVPRMAHHCARRDVPFCRMCGSAESWSYRRRVVKFMWPGACGVRQGLLTNKRARRSRGLAFHHVTIV
jgi:hypothetical protein